MQKGTTQVTVIPIGIITATSTSGTIASGNYSNLIAYLNITAISGTTPSLTVTLQDSPDGITWYNIPAGTFTAATTISTQRLTISNVGQYVRTISTVTGTTPSFTVDLQLIGN